MPQEVCCTHTHTHTHAHTHTVSLTHTLSLSHTLCLCPRLRFSLSAGVAWFELRTAASGTAACTSNADCELNGVCTHQQCHCNPGWVGPSCGTLDVLPAPVAGVWPAYRPNASSPISFPRQYATPPPPSLFLSSSLLVQNHSVHSDPACAVCVALGRYEPVSWGFTAVQDAKTKKYLRH